MGTREAEMEKRGWEQISGGQWVHPQVGKREERFDFETAVTKEQQRTDNRIDALTIVLEQIRDVVPGPKGALGVQDLPKWVASLKEERDRFLGITERACKVLWVEFDDLPGKVGKLQGRIDHLGTCLGEIRHTLGLTCSYRDMPAAVERMVETRNLIMVSDGKLDEETVRRIQSYLKRGSEAGTRLKKVVLLEGESGHIATGVLLKPDVVDAQGDLVGKETIGKVDVSQVTIKGPSPERLEKDVREGLRAEQEHASTGEVARRHFVSCKDCEGQFAHHEVNDAVYLYIHQLEYAILYPHLSKIREAYPSRFASKKLFCPDCQVPMTLMPMSPEHSKPRLMCEKCGRTETLPITASSGIGTIEHIKTKLVIADDPSQDENERLVPRKVASCPSEEKRTVKVGDTVQVKFCNPDANVLALKKLIGELRVDTQQAFDQHKEWIDEAHRRLDALSSQIQAVKDFIEAVRDRDFGPTMKNVADHEQAIGMLANTLRVLVNEYTSRTGLHVEPLQEQFLEKWKP